MLRGRRKAGTGPARPPPSLTSVAIRLLARREYGRAELAMRLRARGADDEAVQRTLDEVAALGYLSDARYAEAVVASRRGRFSARAIAYALKDKRVADDAARAALALLAGGDDIADAASLRLRRFGEPPRDQREKARQVRFLLSRGYSMSVALKVLRDAGAAEMEEPGAR